MGSKVPPTHLCSEWVNLTTSCVTGDRYTLPPLHQTNQTAIFGFRYCFFSVKIIYLFFFIQSFSKCNKCRYFHRSHCRSVPHVPRRPCFTNLSYPMNPSKKAPSMIMERLSRNKLVGQTQNMFENIHM